MNLYLVRHGKTNAKENNRKQAPTSPLSDEGKKQASAVAERLTKEQIDVIISSKWDRAYQTAEAVAKKLEMKFETVEGIHEKEHNPDIYGVDLDSELFKRYSNEIENFDSDIDWKFDGIGESLRDLINRAKKFQGYLTKKYKDKNVLVVSHGQFIRAFVILSILGESYDDKTFYKIYTSMTISNTGISLFEYFPDRDHWELIYLNDHLHTR